ncbi:MAG TPA: sigma-54-dependent Fis family transcriptional regulator, partial [Clostridia bacterium]|nr:sigma-54-dependent Fis family transcriptional regulator [Clostridia bacterium]
RMDLFYRLNVVSLTLPPLREKREDIPLLAKYFLSRFNKKHGNNCSGFSREALSLLERAPWPGNVRQLENVVERAVVLCDGQLITAKDLPPSLRENDMGQGDSSCYREAVQNYERKLLLDALRAHDWIQARAARTLGVNRSTLHEMMKRLDIKAEDN